MLGLYAAALVGIGDRRRRPVRDELRRAGRGDLHDRHLVHRASSAPALNLPDVVHDLALTSHYGFTMLGQWDAVGVVASAVLAVGGVLVGAWGFRRRDLRG